MKLDSVQRVAPLVPETDPNCPEALIEFPTFSLPPFPFLGGQPGMLLSPSCSNECHLLHFCSQPKQKKWGTELFSKMCIAVGRWKGFSLELTLSSLQKDVNSVEPETEELSFCVP